MCHKICQIFVHKSHSVIITAKMSCSHNSITANGAREEVQHWRTGN